MKAPKSVNILIQWIDEDDIEHIIKFDEHTLEDAETLIELMTGNICEADLEP
jgi:hypothetical protein